MNITLAIELNNIEYVKNWLKFNNIDELNSYGYTPSFLASMYGRIDIVKLLLNSGANINFICYDNSTSLMTAANNGRGEIVRILLDAGANQNIRNDYGKTALDFAIQKGYNDIIQMLQFSAKPFLAVYAEMTDQVWKNRTIEYHALNSI